MRMKLGVESRNMMKNENAMGYEEGQWEEKRDENKT